MKENLKKITNSKVMPFIILFLAMLALNIFKSVSYGDDTWFAGITTGTVTKEVTSMSSYMEWRYNTWSSRLIIEFFLITFAKSFGVLWKILDAGVLVLLAYSIYKVFCSSKENKSIMRWIVVFLVALISQNLLSTAGWIATTLNYSWVIAFGVFSLIPIRKCLDSEKIKLYEIPLFILSIIYAANSEQMCAVLFTVYTIFSIYLLIKKKIRPIIWIMLLITIISLIFILTCPGNKVRTEQEITNYFSNFESLSLFNKLEISIVSTMQYFIFNFNIIYVIFTLLIAITVYKKYEKNLLAKAIVTFPVIMGVAFNVLAPITQSCFPDLYNGLSFMNVTNNASFAGNLELGRMKSLVPLMISTLNLGLIVVSVYLSFGNTKKSVIAILCIMAGICTRMLMGFMPSIYVSGNRTQLIFIVSMLIISVLMLDEEKENNLNKYINVLLVFEILTFINNFSLSLSVR